MQLKKIKEILKKHENELREKFGIREIMIFGSTVRGEATEKSDVDILAAKHISRELREKHSTFQKLNQK